MWRLSGVLFAASCVNLPTTFGSGDTSAPETDQTSPTGETGASGGPDIGAHGISFYRYYASSPTTISTPPMDGSGTPSVWLATAGRGAVSAFDLPTDSLGNTAISLGGPHTYTLWPYSGTDGYAFVGVSAGTGYTISTTTPSQDEITLGAVEVVGGSTIVDQQWSEVLAPPLTSASVVTTGPAVLVAFWWGDGFVPYAQTATPSDGFVLLDSVLEPGSLVQCAIAAKVVDSAGTYDVTWTTTPIQGAQLWLVAVQ